MLRIWKAVSREGWRRSEAIACESDGEGLEGEGGRTGPGLERSWVFKEE